MHNHTYWNRERTTKFRLLNSYFTVGNSKSWPRALNLMAPRGRCAEVWRALWPPQTLVMLVVSSVRLSPTAHGGHALTHGTEAVSNRQFWLLCWYIECQVGHCSSWNHIVSMKNYCNWVSAVSWHSHWTLVSFVTSWKLISSRYMRFYAVTPSSLASAISRIVYPSGTDLPRLSWKKRLLNSCVCVCVCVR